MIKRLYLMLCAETLKWKLLFRLVRKLGVSSEVVTINDHLYGSSELSGLPSKVRNKYILKQVKRYCKGLDVGSHIPGFHPFLAPPSSWPKYPDLLLSRGLVPPHTILPVVDRLNHDRPVDGISLGLHIHAFNLDGLTELRDAITVNKTLPELYITGPEENRTAVSDVFKDYAKLVTFVACDNIGRDVVPFLSLLPVMRDAGYDLIGHVHIKKSVHRNNNFLRKWSDFLITSMVGDIERGIGAIDDMSADFISSEERASVYLPHNSKPLHWKKTRQIAEELFPILHSGPLPDRYVCSLGTMFWATPRYLQNFEALDLPWSELASEPIPDDGTVLHVIERLFGALAVARGDKIVICPASDMSFVLAEKLYATMEGYE